MSQTKIRWPITLDLLEAIFFAAGKPLIISTLATELGWDKKELREMVHKLAEKLVNSKAELQLIEVQRDRWVLTLPLDNQYPYEFQELVDLFLYSDYPRRALHDDEIRKVLTTIAFHQPISHAKLWKTLAGVSQGDGEDEPWLSIPKLQNIVDKLVQEGLINANLKVTPVQYRTSKLFADTFGFDSTRQKLKQQLIRRLEKQQEALREAEESTETENQITQNEGEGEESSEEPSQGEE